MQDFQKLDINFSLKTKLSKENIEIYDVCNPPFKVYGLILPENEEDCFHRMPLEEARKVSEAVSMLQMNTAGGRVRFKTDSSYIAVHAEIDSVTKMGHMPLAGSAGFDLYANRAGKETYLHSFIPPQSIDTDKVFESEYHVFESSGQMQEYTLNFPLLYSCVRKLYIILDKEAKVEAPKNYRFENPVVYYGSSITQGACASRPGNSYQSIISRRFNIDYVNLGFSGNAKGELSMAEYIADMKMHTFVFDYDFNAPDLEFLRNTHEPFYKIVRKKNPTLPIICISKPFGKGKTDWERRNLIKSNVDKWKSEGDKYIYFVDGYEFREMFHAGDSIVVDGTHPNDLGFWCMAELIGNKLSEVI